MGSDVEVLEGSAWKGRIDFFFFNLNLNGSLRVGKGEHGIAAGSALCTFTSSVLRVTSLTSLCLQILVLFVD